MVYLVITYSLVIAAVGGYSLWLRARRTRLRQELRERNSNGG